ncbi:MAG TPA: DUF3263 domain-containing protein [Acidimicrobiia bacterium]
MLGSEERAILDFERGWWLLGGAKDMLVESSLGLPADAYYERLLALLDDPDAEAYDPLTMRRVRSMIELPGTGEVVGL